ncbi:MAG: cell division protein FtsX [Paenibacillus sp.]|nr:cell division protein FtsX [Paenibacillus sp.]
MRISTFTRHMREGAANVVRNGWMTFASISAISISLFVLGVFLMLALNVNHLADQIESQVEIRVYLDTQATEQQRNMVQKQIAAIPEVSKVTFVSKQEGLNILREKMGEENKELLEGFDGDSNPLNDSFTVEVIDPRQVGVAADQIKALDASNNPPLLDKVNYGKGTVEYLFKVTDIVQKVGLVFVLLLALTSMFLISNTIKITIVARRREIGIMKLVGATNSFIRWPFFIEGALLGFIGSAIPVGLLIWGYSEFLKYMQVPLGLMLVKLIPVHEIIVLIPVLLIGIGMMIGIWGSVLSIRKFLKV